MTREDAAKLLDLVKAFDVPKLSKAIEMAKAALREQPRWISVEERLPEDGQKVLICTKTKLIKDARYSRRRGCFITSGNITATHWMPLPQPPEVI